MSAITTSTSLPPPVAQRFNEKLLATPQARLIHKAFATPYVMPDRSGDIMRMRRYTRLNTFPVPLNVSFNNPPAQQLNMVDLDARIDWFATYVILTRQVSVINEDPVLNAAAARLGQSINIRVDFKSNLNTLENLREAA